MGRYVDALLPALEAEGVDLRVVCQARDADQTAALVPGADVLPVHGLVERRPARLAWEQTALPLLARRGVDLLHSPHYTFPVATPVPLVVTLHDATFFSHPQLHSPVKARFFRTATRLAVRRAAGLVVPSRATRDEVVRYAGGSPSRFTVAYHGVDTGVFHPVDAAERARVRAAIGLGADEPYVAFLGTLEPRKNVPALIEGWVRACEGGGPAPALVLAGGSGWDTAVDAAVSAVPAGLRLIRTGYLPLGDLAGLLSGATVVAYPSLGEGFGLPVLEAMACRAAVLTTRELSLPEVGGDAVAYTGTAAADIAGALRSLLDDAPERARLAAAAEERAAGFTWREAARAHVAAYEDALAARR